MADQTKTQVDVAAAFASDEHPTSVTIPAGLTSEDVSGDERGAAAGHGRYTEGRGLGQGGMASVTLCRDELIGREVAMKTILPELQAKPSVRTRFLREASIQGQLEHPSIVPIHDIGVRPDGTAFFVMKRVRGLTLQRVLTDLAEGNPEIRERFSLRRLLNAFVSVCLAVDFAHSRGVLHRDLKPSNVMLGSFGEVYLLDWGVAKLVKEPNPDAAAHEDPVVPPTARSSRAPKVEGPETIGGSVIGTLGYMAPEQLLGAEVTFHADVFALGAILFEILTGEPLWPADSTFVAIARGKVDARCSIRAPDRRVPPELESICVRATASSPAERYASARALSRDVERFLEGDRDLVLRR